MSEDMVIFLLSSYMLSANLRAHLNPRNGREVKWVIGVDAYLSLSSGSVK